MGCVDIADIHCFLACCRAFHSLQNHFTRSLLFEILQNTQRHFEEFCFIHRVIAPSKHQDKLPARRAHRDGINDIYLLV